VADFLAVFIIIVFVSAGYFMGTIRALASMLGIFAAFSITDQMARNGAAENNYIGVFLAVFIGITIVGLLFYGHTRVTLIESLEGILGAIMGLVIGWGFARFIFSVYMFYRSQTEFAGLIQSGLISMDIYLVTPFQLIMDRTESMRQPKI
jgi:hypothetical protein